MRTRTEKSIDPASLRDILVKQVRLGANCAGRLSPGVFARKVPIKHRDEIDPRMLGSRVVRPGVPGDTAELVLSVLLNGNFRRGNLSSLGPYMDHFRETIGRHVAMGVPVSMVLPTLPFKSQNPLATGHSPEFVDLGEWLLFAQLKSMIESVQGVYGPGLRVVLLCDGTIYAHIFSDGSLEGIRQYFDRNRKIAEVLGLEGVVELVDMETLLRREEDFCSVKAMVRGQLAALERTDAAVQESMRSLRQGMLFNIGFPEYDGSDLIALLQDGRALPTRVEERISEAALEYAALLIAMQHRGVIRRSFPNALRATVHPKAAPQIPLHLMNRDNGMSPHNGVPVVSQSKFERQGSFREATRTMRLCEVLALQCEVAAVHAGTGSEPFYYQVD